MPNLFDILTECVTANDYTAAIQFIEENRNDIHKIEFDGNPNPAEGLLHFVVRTKNTALLRAFLSIPHTVMNTRENPELLRPLHRAILSNWVEGVRLLIANPRVDVTAQGSRDFLPPYEFAVKNNCSIIAELIRAEIARRDRLDRPRSDPRFVSDVSTDTESSSSDDDFVEPLSHSQPDEQVTTSPVRIRATEFLNAAESGQLTTVQQYINSLGRNDHLALNVRREATRETALMLAAAGGDRTIVDVLIDAKADLAATNNRGLTAAQLAEGKGHVEIASYLMQLMTDLSSKTSTTSASPAIPIKNPNNFAARLAKIKRHYTIPAEYICPISQEICNEPIEIHGDLYDRVSLIAYFDAHPGMSSLLNPLTKDPTKPILKTELTKRTSQIGESAIRNFVAEQERLDAAEQSTSSQAHANQDHEPLRPAFTK